MISKLLLKMLSISSYKLFVDLITQMIETQMAVKARQVTELETQAKHLERTVPEKMGEIKEKKSAVEARFQKLKEPLVVRQRQLEKNKEAFQVGCNFIILILGMVKYIINLR